jgi:hypothetical protein
MCWTSTLRTSRQCSGNRPSHWKYLKSTTNPSRLIPLLLVRPAESHRPRYLCPGAPALRGANHLRPAYLRSPWDRTTDVVPLHHGASRPTPEEVIERVGAATVPATLPRVTAWFSLGLLDERPDARRPDAEHLGDLPLTIARGRASDTLLPLVGFVHAATSVSDLFATRTLLQPSRPRRNRMTTDVREMHCSIMRFSFIYG